MKAISGVLLSGVLILAAAGVALGHDTDPKVSGATSSGTGSTGTVETQGPVDAHGVVQTTTVTETGAEANASLNAIRERARKASTKAHATVQKELGEISRKVDAEVSEEGSAVVAGRIAPEFGMTAEAMIAEQAKLEVTMGELMIAHTLAANSKVDVAAEQLFMLQHEGLGWGQIAHGLNLRLGEVTAAVKSEGNVAAGVTKADGKPAAIRSGTHVAASTNSGVQAGPAHTGAASSVGVGVKLGK